MPLQTFKEQGGTTSVPATMYRNTSCGAQNQVLQTSSVAIVRDYSLIRGMNTPNFKKLLRRGEIIPATSFVQYRQNGRLNKSAYDVQQVGYPGTCNKTREWWSPYISYGTPFGASEASMTSMLKDMDAMSKLQEIASRLYTRGMDLGTSLAELHKTVHMVRNVGWSLGRLVKAIRVPTGVKSDTRYRLDAAASLWLEGRYGWRILSFELQDLYKAVTAWDNSRVRFKGSGKGGSTTWTSNSTYTWPAGAQYNAFTVYTARTYTQEMRAGIIADLSPPRFMINPLVTGWEIIPFSFVLDWFFSVGDAIGAAMFRLSVKDYTAWFGYRLTEEYHHYWNKPTAKAGYVINDFSYDSTAFTTLEIRTPTSVSIIPEYRMNLNSLKLVDLAALALQLRAVRSLLGFKIKPISNAGIRF